MSKITRRCAVWDIAPFTHAAFRSIQPFHVAVLRKYLGLEPAHGARARCLSVRAATSNDHPHRRIVGQAFSVVGILVARQTTVHRLPEKRYQLVLHVTPAPSVLQALPRLLRQSHRTIQLAAGQQSGV